MLVDPTLANTLFVHNQGDHILIDRDDRRSQLKTFKDGIGWLKKGVPIMAFPEGRRSPDGRLMDFKGGLFSMAVKTKVPIIPITIGHANAVMPGNAIFPVQAGSGKLHVHIHEAIDTEGKSDDELVRLVREAFLSTLPFNQHPLNEEVGQAQEPPMLRVTSESQSQHTVRIQTHATNHSQSHHSHQMEHDHHLERVPFFIVNEKEEAKVVYNK
jgi:1-acyl-sn-glycerol-3-phosphate acyltransferase